MVFSSLDALKTSSKKKETRAKKKIVEVLALTSDLLVRIILTLISSLAITGCFQKVNFQGFNLVILNFIRLPSVYFFGYVNCDSLLCTTNRCVKVSGKTSVSRFKFCSP